MKPLLARYMKTTEVLTDKEIVLLVTYFNNLLENLRDCPDEYLLVKHDAFKRLDRLQSWQKARKENNH